MLVTVYGIRMPTDDDSFRVKATHDLSHVWRRNSSPADTRIQGSHCVNRLPESRTLRQWIEKKKRERETEREREREKAKENI